MMQVKKVVLQREQGKSVLCNKKKNGANYIRLLIFCYCLTNKMCKVEELYGNCAFI